MLKNTVALVTGCANGFGRATLKRFLEEGAHVVGVDLKPSNEAQLPELDPNVLFCQADLSDENQVKQCMEKITNTHGHLNILVNCAGIANTFPLYSSSRWTLDKFELSDSLLQHNLLSTFNVCRLSIPLFLKNTPTADGERGVIINTSGFLATEGNRSQSFLAAVSGAINSMTVPLARELESEGIRVVTISPGLFKTPLTCNFPAQVESFLTSLQAHPQRLGDTDEFADHAVTVISNKMLNGVVIRLDAGFRNHY